MERKPIGKLTLNVSDIIRRIQCDVEDAIKWSIEENLPDVHIYVTPAGIRVCTEEERHQIHVAEESWDELISFEIDRLHCKWGSTNINDLELIAKAMREQSERLMEVVNAEIMKNGNVN